MPRSQVKRTFTMAGEAMAADEKVCRRKCGAEEKVALTFSVAASVRIARSSGAVIWESPCRRSQLTSRVQSRRMIYRVFTILSALSLVYCVVEVVVMLYVPWKHGPGESVKFDVPMEMPNSLSIAFFSVLPAAWVSTYVWSKWRAPARSRSGCRVCGYDLRATPDRCPECGTERKAKC